MKRPVVMHAPAAAEGLARRELAICGAYPVVTGEPVTCEECRAAQTEDAIGTPVHGATEYLGGALCGYRYVLPRQSVSLAGSGLVTCHRCLAIIKLDALAPPLRSVTRGASGW